MKEKQYGVYAFNKELNREVLMTTKPTNRKTAEFLKKDGFNYSQQWRRQYKNWKVKLWNELTTENKIMKSIKELEARLLFETKQSNEFRMRRGESKTADQKKAWQTLIDLADESKNELRKKIETMKKSQGLKKPTVKGLKKVCSHVVKATGLKVDGTLKKGYKYATGGKIVKVAPAKKPVVKKKAVKKPVVKKKAAKK